MKASELRIGNLVWLKSKSMPYVISSGHDIEEIDDAPEGFDATPIELTEEWLLKFGFEEWKVNIFRKNWGRNGVEFITFCPDGFFFELGKGSYRHLEYVHRLQNIFFALTGEELTFNTNEK